MFGVKTRLFSKKLPTNKQKIKVMIIPERFQRLWALYSALLCQAGLTGSFGGSKIVDFLYCRMHRMAEVDYGFEPTLEGHRHVWGENPNVFEKIADKQTKNKSYDHSRTFPTSLGPLECATMPGRIDRFLRWLQNRRFLIFSYA